MASVNLEENSELASLTVQYREKISKSVKEVFNIDVEFDKVVIHRLSGIEDNIPYENASTDENSGFSPTVAVLTVGPPDAGARPMFMKTKTGNIVTHKIALTSGSLCTLSGRTECRYRRSVPKDYGVKGDQFFIFFIQRTPDSSILSELMKIPIQHNGSPKSSICKNSSIYKIQENTKPLPVSDPESQRITDDQHVVSDNSATQNILKTPPTVKRTVPEPLQFVDAMDFEVDGGLLLAESLGTAVDNMDSETLTRELIRNHTSIAGNEDQKKARLQQRLSMTIGELTSTAANNSVNVAHLLSPTESVENFRQDLERVSNSQACIENTLTKVIESIVNIREDVTGIRANNVVLKDELSKPPPSQMTLPGIKELSHQVAECAAKIQQLNENIAAVREDLASVQDSVATLSTSTQDSLKDLHVWHNSAFSDEDSQRIKTVYDHILKYQDTADNIMYIKHATCQTEDDIDKQTMSLIPNEQEMEVEHTQSSEIPPEEQRQSRSVNRPSTFDWPDAMHLSLKTAVLSAKPIRVCLISDSIMRHNTVFDAVDMENFEKFFTKLYTNDHQTITTERKATLLEESVQIAERNDNSNNDHTNELNKPFTCKEISDTISELKNGKSSSDDLICNEILKYLTEGPNGTQLLEKLFNKCFDTATYPWNNSIITPLHKKGCKSDPDNYRAVAVSSTIGKLFSTILLNRILSIKSKICPDPINQLGFSKGAQTFDHILTLKTIISKYKKLKQPVYAVFVDFRKAFDSVCREALFFKLANQGISGKIFNILKHMYANSSGQIKLAGHLSKKFGIQKGTEHGHPLSPDFFKLYINDLSPFLEHENCPMLINKIVSHLLWADDLILLSLDPITLQKQLNSLSHFCTAWGVDINMAKTKLIVFNTGFRDTIPVSFRLGGKPVPEADSYCYLGIEIDKNGKFILARNELKKKALKSLYSLKSTINKKFVSFRALTTLFDGLIKPIALYGAPIWTTDMTIIRNLTKLFNYEQIESNSNILKKISLLACEKIHIHFLKWALGVNRKASNAGAWGESGRYPLIYECISLTLKYFNRVKCLKNDSLVSLAYQEQRRLNLEWHKGIELILKIDPCYSADHVSSFRFYKNKAHTIHCTSSHTNIPPNTRPRQNSFIIHCGTRKLLPDQKLVPNFSERYSISNIIKHLKNQFRNLWESSIIASSKLSFYQTYKKSFVKEPYLDFITDCNDRQSLTRLRISAHHLEIEKGRHKNVARENRICTWCKLCMGQDVIENENHLLNECDLYEANRKVTLQKLSSSFLTSSHSTYTSTHPHFTTSSHSDNIITLLPPHDHLEDTKNAHFYQTLARFITICFKRRKQLHESLSPA